MINIVIFGPPGVGKGTQSEKLIQYFNLNHISTGEILREERAKGTELGIKAEEYHGKGNLVPSELVNDLMHSVIKERVNVVNGFIFDGYPRRVDQAEVLDNILTGFDVNVDIVFNLHVYDDTLRERLLERGKTSNRLDDQNIETINKRIDVYKTETKPVLDYYNRFGKVYNIDGSQDIDKVFSDIIDILKIVLPNSDTSVVPEGLYCYKALGYSQEEGESFPYLKVASCPYWSWIGNESGGSVCSIANNPKTIDIVDQLMLDDQSKICAINHGE